MQFLEEKKSHQHCKNAIVDFKIRFLRLQFTYHIIKRKVCFKKNHAYVKNSKKTSNEFRKYLDYFLTKKSHFFSKQTRQGDNTIPYHTDVIIQLTGQLLSKRVYNV